MRPRILVWLGMGVLALGGAVYAIAAVRTRSSSEEVESFLQTLALREVGARYSATRVLYADSDAKPVEVEFLVQQDGQGGRRLDFKGVRVDGKVMFDMDRMPWPKQGERKGHDDGSKGWGGSGSWDWQKWKRDGWGNPWPWTEGLPGSLLISDPHRAAQQYALAKRTGPRFLNRETLEVTLDPRRGDRAAYRILVDRQEGVGLQLEVRIPGRGWRRAFSHGGVDFSVRPEGLPKIPDRPPGSPDLGALRLEAGFDVARPRYLPRGFELVRAGVAASGGVKTAYLVYSDGANSLFVLSSDREPWWRRFETAPSERGVPVARSRRGTCTEYGLKLDGVIVTVAGPLVEVELEEVVRSLGLGEKEVGRR